MISIVDDIGKVVQSMREGGGYESYYEDEGNSLNPPYYLFGHRKEISNRLTEMGQRPISKTKKYPLIALNTRSNNILGVRGNVVDFNLNIIIGTQVKETLSSKEREDEIFKPILYPLYEKFKVAFKDSGLFMWPSELPQDFPPHVPMISYFWGIENTEGAIKNIFNDPMCVIEIVNLKFSKNYEGIC